MTRLERIEQSLEENMKAHAEYVCKPCSECMKTGWLVERLRECEGAMKLAVGSLEQHGGLVGLRAVNAAIAALEETE